GSTLDPMTAVPPRRRTAALARAWRATWPVVAGVVAAVGLLGTWRLTSLLAVVFMIAGLWVFVAVVLYGVASESGLGIGSGVRIGLVASVSTIVLLGLVDVFPAAGWFVALAVGVTSPALADWAAPYVSRGMAALQLRTFDPESDQGAVDRAFDQIVADIDNDA